MGTVRQKLFMVLVGGQTPTANIELHDMRFAVGEKISDTYETLQNEWWGDPDTLHVDVWAEVRQIDGYNVTVRAEPYKGREKLYFVNLGGYEKTLFDEVHRNVLKVATAQEKAKADARAEVTHWHMPHKDNLFEVENILPLSQFGELHVHLEKAEEVIPFDFHCRYTPISKKALAKKAAK